VAMEPVAIVDYGAGNVRSAQKALEHLGCPAEITGDAARIASAPGVVLPGQGAFGSCMRSLEAAGLVAPVRDAACSGRPFLGICVGMQILFERSDESPGVDGLGVFRGRVVRFPRHPERKVPHMGWDQLRIVRPTPWLAGVPDGSWVYFVHSYYPVPEEPEVVVTTTTYGHEFASSVGRGAAYAAVFHPEKSQQIGLRMLGNFVDRVRAAA